MMPRWFCASAIIGVLEPAKAEGLEPPPGAPGCAIAMDAVESQAEEFPRIHLDLDAGDRDLDEEVERLVGLGAQHVDWRHYPEDPHPTEPPYVVLADPDGNRFCVAGRRRPAGLARLEVFVAPA